MFCKNCGNELNNSEKFCKNCGSLNELYSESVPEVNITPEEPSENTFMNTQPFSIDEVAQIVEEKKEEVPSTPVEPVTVEPTPVVETPTVEEPKTEPAPAPEQPVINTGLMESGMTVEPKKKSNIGFIVIVIALIVVILGLGGFIAYKLLGNRGGDTPTVEPTPNKEIKKDEPKKEEKKNTYSASGYTFTIPSGFELSNYEGADRIGDSNFQIGFIKTISSEKYSDYKTYFEDATRQIRERLEPEGATFLTSSEQTFGGRNFLIFSFMYDGYYNDACLTELSDGTLIYFTSVYRSATYKYDGYTKTATFMDSAVKDSNSSLTGDSKVEFKSNILNKMN